MGVCAQNFGSARLLVGGTPPETPPTCRTRRGRGRHARRFAENFAAARLENQQFGKHRVVRDLLRRRVAPALAESTAGKTFQQVDEVALIEQHIRRKYKDKKRVGLFKEEKDLASAYRRLLRAGFSTGNIIRVLKRFAANPELLDGFEPPAEPDEE
jgi:hypothetical protein